MLIIIVVHCQLLNDNVIIIARTKRYDYSVAYLREGFPVEPSLRIKRSI